eukprot:PhF_6_TR36919/c0_g1_i1/m.54147
MKSESISSYACISASVCVVLVACLWSTGVVDSYTNMGNETQRTPLQVGARWQQYYSYVVTYLKKTKYTLEPSIFDLPNTRVFNTSFSELTAKLKCTSLAKQPLSSKEVFKCNSKEEGNYFIKVPRNSTSANQPFIKGVLGS